MNRRTLIALACVFFASVSNARATEWTTVRVPGEQSFTGYAWYQVWFKPAASFFSEHERDLFGESVVLSIRGLAGAHEAYINGTRIGGGGQFPPQFEDSREGNHRHKIPSGLLIPDQWNEVTIKVYNPEGPSGFLTEAPFVMDYFSECMFEGDWKFRPGAEQPELRGALKDKPATAFDEFHQSNRVLGEADKLVHGEKLPPEKSFAKMKAADDLAVDLMLSEPLVAQPTHFSFDARGRLWVAQYRQYPYPAGLKMISRDQYYRSHYDKTPPPPPNHDRGRDVISVHEDTDGDGKYDRHKVFQDGLNMANAALPGRGGVWVMQTPYLLFYPDQDFDDVPDGPPVVHLEGFGLEDTHSVANGLVWGMDGWLYGAQGSTTSCHVKRPGVDRSNSPGVYFQGCMVWRYHPETRRFEIFAEGGGNNFGLEVDSAGRVFTGNNGGLTRGWHYMQGGVHLMQGTTPEKFGPPRNPFAFGDLPHMESEQDIPRFTHFATLVESTAIPQKYHNSFFSVDPLHNFLIASHRLTKGATFKTSDIGKVLTSDDFAFRPVYIGNAPDGSVLVADFYEHYIAHGQHYQSQIDPTTGRIYRLRGKQEKLEQNLNLHDLSTDQLIDMLGHANRWHRHTAVRLLGERKDPAAAPKLRQLVARGRGLQSLNALWALYQAQGLDHETALAALTQEHAAVRYWAVRLICDDVGFAHKRSTIGLADSLGELQDRPTRVPEELFQAVLTQAAQEQDAEVRSQMAGSARRLPVDQALALVSAVLEHDEDLEDPYVPLLCWWVFEVNLDRHRDAVMAKFEDGQFRQRPMVVAHILGRLMQALALKGKNQDLQQCTRLLELSKEQQQVDKLLNGFEQAFAGRRMVGLPDRLAQELVKSGRSSLVLRLRLGDAAATREAIELLLNDNATAAERIAVARTLGEVRTPESLEPLLKVSVSAPNAELQRAALTASSAFTDPAIGAQLMKAFASISEEVRPAFFDVMLSRVEWTRLLVEGLQSGSVTPTSIPADVADQLRRHPDPGVSSPARQHLGAGDSLDQSAVNRRIQEVRALLADGSGNPYAGEAIFTQRCAACHKLFHKGGQVGPDLTPYQRGDLETLLTSVLNPNAEIREGFEYVNLLTVDGRTLSGFVTDEDTQIITVRGKAGEDIRVERSDVEELAPVGISLMPENLLGDLSDQQLRDLFAYLRISQPISP
jgi:putative heme-binding domain-containing protein